jgi:peptidoglycan/xylan/chitin deacetylase (PgdA/CDA1 family)
LRRVTLSFDNGPEPAVTPGVIDCLARHGIKATFFVLGSKVIRPEAGAIARRARGEGHWIGNHTFTHTKRLGEMDEREALAEFDRTEEALAWVEQPRRLFRPYGSGVIGHNLLHPAVAQRILSLGITCVLWNSVPGDWRDPDGWLERGLADCRTRDWSLVALHDIPSGAMAHLECFLTRLRAEGFEFTQDFPPDCLPTSLENYCSSGILR